ncbi:MAG TPA: glycosyltransferase, partial [Sulfurovum sp.]|nr:glycosyltransferase [Sulfurovum sp.]
MKLGIVIPCYNEEEVILEINKRLQTLLDSMIENGDISNESFICFVDDGSTDDTWDKIKEVQEKNSYVKGIKLSRNFGHQNALIAGLMQLQNDADALISMDADLQDDIGLIENFVEKYKEGYEIVYG